MSTVVLRASGYTWKCPECGRENYTGAAPAEVACKGCHAEFQVKELHHRRMEPEEPKSERKNVRKAEVLPLFAEAPPMSADDEIPF
jgi:hypothetical protein